MLSQRRARFEGEVCPSPISSERRVGPAAIKYVVLIIKCSFITEAAVLRSAIDPQIILGDAGHVACVLSRKRFANTLIKSVCSACERYHKVTECLEFILTY